MTSAEWATLEALSIQIRVFIRGSRDRLMCQPSHTGHMASEEATAERVAVRTYVPPAQRDEWDGHAEKLDMSRSEFVRTMVQAGRRGFDPRGNAAETAEDDAPVEPPEEDSGQTLDGATAESFDDTVLDLLDERECLSWNELFEALTDDVEQRLDDALGRLQTANEIKHSGKRGGYVRTQ